MTFRFLKVLTTLLLLTTAAAAQDAETNQRELHVVAARDGNIRTGDRIHGPEVRVTVDRPGQQVVLAINPRSPIRFLVDHDETTQIESIYLFGRSSEKSEVLVNGELQTAIVVPSVRNISRKDGAIFRGVVRKLTEATGFDRIASVNLADPRHPEVPVGVASVEDRANYRRVYLSDFLEPDRLTDSLRAHLDGTAQLPEVKSTTEGFVLFEAGATTTFPVTLDVPHISHPVAAAFDPVGRRIFGVTLGGEGFLYLYDIEADRWSVMASMQQEDATGIIYDPERERVLIAVNRTRRGTGNLREWSEGAGLRPFTIGVKISDLPGLTDLYEPNPGSGAKIPDMALLAIDGDELLVRNVPPGYGRRPDIQPPFSRTYVIDVETAEAALVAYRGD